VEEFVTRRPLLARELKTCATFLLFAAIAITASLPLISNVHVLIEFVRAIGSY
jgi:hypothetical protein